MLQRLNDHEQLQILFDQFNFKLHVPGAASDTLMLRWWMELHETGDITKLFHADSFDLESFLQLFKPPTYLVYDFNESNTIEQASWAKPVSNILNERTAFNGIWTRPFLRGKPRQLLFTHLTYKAAFGFFDAIVGMTWQPELLAIHAKMGYDVVGVLPDFMGHELVYLVRVTKEKYFDSRLAQAGEKLLNKEIG
jgi:hypothetical protein